MLNSTAFAQEKAPVAAEATPKQSETAPVETFALPETIDDFEQLIAFVEEIDSLEPTGSGEREMIAHQRKVARTVVAAAETLFAKKISDEDAMQSVYFKLQGLHILQELDEPKASELLVKAIEVALADKRSDVRAVGTKFMVESGFAQWDTWDEEEKAGLIDRIIQVVSSSEPEGSQVDLVMKVVGFLSQKNSEVYARQLLSKLMPHFQSSQDPQIQQMLTLLEGIERRMNLPGGTMKLSGTLLDGSELDWASYRGKVVLVDFSATWCPPCRAEVPHVLKMYQDYHDKGFEVLGISLDKSPEEAEAYIEQMKIPWPTMFSKNPAERFWKHPMAVYYGVTGIPLAILVDRDGKVVHLLARGENLSRELRRLLGEPVARSQQRTDALVQQVSNPPASNK
ncbi:MAG: TlpA family protein disulfide reductase [Planctomycetes bacterium]|nr:TlpA family protein disulfide reductase [Planctomycetota bacterium]